MSKSYQLVFIMALFSFFSSYSMQPVKEDSRESENWEKIDGHAYHFDNKKKSHSDAKATCQSIGGKLFEPKSEKAYNEVSALAKTKGISNFWLGIHDISNEGTFVYDSDGKDLVWTYWNSGEPNDWRKRGEDCARSDDRSKQNKWNDDKCDSKFSFICEKPVCEKFDADDYHFDIKKKSHSDAKATCQSIGGKLFEPKCEKVYNEVSALAKTKGISNFWLGIHDISNEGKFIYDSDGKDLVWTNWNSGEPNNWRKGEDCVRSDDRSATKYKWNDDKCGSKYSIICEKSATATPTTTPAATPTTTSV